MTIAVITAKARVTPVNESRMPRLELTAAHLLKLPLDKAYSWSDSIVVFDMDQKNTR